ncbi:MAG: endonuclease domain-containing protein [Moraxellaceae bacterium]|nr:MAG: endonuclease domain-containing protein [Moraxellaceae bacterium]
MEENTDKIFNRKQQKPLRQELRKTASPIERLLWAKIRGGQLGVKFRRQHGIGPYIVDFYCPAVQLIIELDGDSHYWQGQREYDQVRNEYVKAQGLKILRFTNLDVTHNIDGVIQKIFEHLIGLIHSNGHANL